MAGKLISKLRDFPSVEELLQNKFLCGAIRSLPRPVAARIVKRSVEEAKRDMQQTGTGLSLKSLLDNIISQLEEASRHEIRKVINATGIVAHTNLGRAPLDESLFQEIQKSVTGYSNIELDTGTGRRGNRGAACEDYLALLSEAEAATVVNNCAAGLFITLNTLANRKTVLVSRGELVQIGGGFRIPDILRKSGARLGEVGSTNITTLEDYEAAIDDKTALILKVHKSNFVQSGFTDEVDASELALLGKKHNLPVINDLGSGAFIATKPILGYKEPTVQQSVRLGNDLTLFSGDKMLGGLQAGIIVGRTDLIKRIKTNPLFRTLRVDKIVFSMLEKLCRFYLDGTHLENIKLWQLLAVPESELYARGKKILGAVASPDLSVEATRVYVGGGTQPKQDLPSVALVFSETLKAARLAEAFRQEEPPVIGRIENNRFMLDLKAIDESDLNLLIQSIRRVLS